MDWRQRIDRAIKHGQFRETDRRLALSYATCVVGERIAQLRGRGIEPSVLESAVTVPTMDAVRKAANMFYNDVENAGRPGYGNPACAARWYDEIQAWEGQA